MTIERIKNDIEKESIPSVYLWCGEDRYSLREALALLRLFFLKEDPSGSNMEYFGGKDLSLETVVEAAQTCSFFSRRLVVADDVTYFSPNKEEGEGGKDKRDALLEYCQNPNPGTCLVLIAEKVNRGRKLYKEIVKTGKVVEFVYPQGAGEWSAWLSGEAKNRGKKISSATAAFFLEWAGHQTGILSRELDKLAFYTGDRLEIQREDIRELCTPLAETTIFAMLDAIAAGNMKDALQKLEQVLQQEHYLKVQTMLVRQVRLLLAAAWVRRQRGTQEEFMTAAGVRSPYEGNKLYRQAASFTTEKLRQALEYCLETEIALKTGGGDPQLLLEILVIRFGRKEETSFKR